jgi:hypothetical protein
MLKGAIIASAKIVVKHIHIQRRRIMIKRFYLLLLIFTPATMYGMYQTPQKPSKAQTDVAALAPNAPRRSAASRSRRHQRLTDEEKKKIKAMRRVLDAAFNAAQSPRSGEQS